MYRFLLPKSKEIGWVGVQRTFADFFNVSSANFSSYLAIKRVLAFAMGSLLFYSLLTFSCSFYSSDK